MTDGVTVTSELDRALDKHRRVAAERAAAVLLVADLVRSGSSIADAIARVAADINKSGRAIASWRAAVRDLPASDWAEALLPQWRGSTRRSECDEAAWLFYLGAYLRPEQPSSQDAYRRTVDVAKLQGWSVPSEKVMRKRLQTEIPVAATVLRRRGSDALEEQYPAQQRDRTCFHALEAVNADGHRWDVQVLWPDGEIARPMAVVWQDLLSGKICSWRVDRTENASAIRLAFGDMVDTYGIPGRAYLDNGRGFASKWMTGQMKHRFRFKIKAEEPTGILNLLGVEVHWVTPYHGQAKPIERCFRDLCETIARHPSFSGAYTGNSPVTKPHNYGTRAIPLADFLRVVDLEVKDHNARTGRSNGACAGELSFDQAFARSYAVAPIRKVTEAQRRLLLLAAEGLKVRDGGIHLLGNAFWSPDLANHMGQSIVARFDPEHVQRGVYVYTTRGAYIGFAECVVAAGFADADAAREHTRKRRSWMKSVKKATRELGIVEPAEVGRLHLEALEQKYGETAMPESKVVRPVFGRGTKPETIIGPTRAELESDEIENDLFARIGETARRQLKTELA